MGRTNDRGEYRVYGIAPGHYYVKAQPGNVDEMPDLHVAGKQPYLPTYYPAAVDIQNATVVEVKGSEELGVDISLQHGKLFLVKGTARSASGPVKQGLVSVVSGIRPIAMQEITSGNFELHLPAGDYTVIASEYKTEEMGSANSAYSIQPFTVGEGTSTLDLALKRPAKAGKIIGFVRTDNGAPLPQVKAYVELVPLLKDSHHFDLNDLIYSGLTSSAGIQVDDQGKFVLTDAKPGTFEVALQATNMEDWFVKAVYANGRDIRDTGLQVSAAPVDLEIVVSPNAASVSGVVKDAAGNLVRDAFVLLAPTDGRSHRLSAFGNTTTDENGGYTIRGLDPGDYVAFAWDDIDDDEWMDPSRLKQWAEHGTKVSMSVGERLTLNLPLIVTADGTPQD